MGLLVNKLIVRIMENYWMAEIGFDGEKINRYFKGKYSDKDATYIEEVLNLLKRSLPIDYYNTTLI